MIYLVSNQKELFKSDVYKVITVEEALSNIESWDVVQFDTETTGRDPHICKILCAQFGNKACNTQIVVDTVTVDLLKFKNILENKLIIGHNLKTKFQL